MTQFFAGWKPGYGPVVKVLKYDADDPLTLSNAAYGRFFFNSEIQNIGYIYSIAAWDYNSGIGSGYTFYPVGSNATTATHGYDSKMSGAISQYVFFFGRRMGHGGILALVEGRKRRANATDFDGPRIGKGPVKTGSSNRWATYWQGYCTYEFRVRRQSLAWGSSSDLPDDATFIELRGATNTETSVAYKNVVSVWDLPCGNEPIPTPVAAPIAGQENVRISPSLVAITRPGFDVATAQGRQCVLSSNRIPAKIIKCGDIAIPANSNVTVSSWPFTLNENCYMDYHISLQADAFAHPPIFYDYGLTNVDFRYQVTPAGVILKNGYDKTIHVRYMICADDDSAGTSGGSQVMLKGNDGAQDYIQIKKPGSSDAAPALSDIMLDTRLKYISIIAEGYLTWGDMTEAPMAQAYGTAGKTISFANDGSFMPFVKTVVDMGTSERDRYRSPLSRIIDAPMLGAGVHMQQANVGTVAIVANTYVKFHMANGNPSYWDFSSGTGAPEAKYSDPTPVGIRYYVFALPLG